MRINCRVAVARKVFCCSDDSASLRSFSKSGSEASNVSRIFTVRPHVYNWIGSIVVDIDNRRKDVLDSHSARFTSSDLALSSRIIRITGCSNCHVPGETDSILEPHSRSGLQISRDEQRVMCELLHSVY